MGHQLLSTLIVCQDYEFVSEEVLTPFTDSSSHGMQFANICRSTLEFLGELLTEESNGSALLHQDDAYGATRSISLQNKWDEKSGDIKTEA